MNERIKELADQAGFYGDPVFENLETFAQLIVKDCAYMADKNWNLGGPTGWIMKQYFGVDDD